MRPFTMDSDYVNQIGLETDEGSERITAGYRLITNGISRFSGRPASSRTAARHSRAVAHPSGTDGSNPAPSSEESNANLMPTTFSQPAVRSLRNRLPIARSTKCPRNPSCVGRL